MILFLETITEIKDSEESWVWSDAIVAQDCHSLLKYVEDNGDRFRGKYLSWIFELGQLKVAEKTVEEHLTLESDYSFWWMTLLTEKSIYKSPLSDAIRLIALDEILTEKGIKNLTIVGDNPKLIRIIEFICKSKSIKCFVVLGPYLSQI